MTTESPQQPERDPLPRFLGENYKFDSGLIALCSLLGASIGSFLGFDGPFSGMIAVIIGVSLKYTLVAPARSILRYRGLVRLFDRHCLRRLRWLADEYWYAYRTFAIRTPAFEGRLDFLQEEYFIWLEGQPEIPVPKPDGPLREAERHLDS
ncbi:MAG: hypothetical protein GY722_27425 [bacterium]|nr:hypothetical protein [bacterium]